MRSSFSFFKQRLLHGKRFFHFLDELINGSEAQEIVDLLAVVLQEPDIRHGRHVVRFGFLRMIDDVNVAENEVLGLSFKLGRAENNLLQHFTSVSPIKVEVNHDHAIGLLGNF